MDRLAVLGLGGVVLYADQADRLAAWYEKHLGIFFNREPDSHEWRARMPAGVSFAINQSKHPIGQVRRHCETMWAVENLDDFIEKLAEDGLTIDERQEGPEGDFAWLNDPEGNRIELFQRQLG